MGSGLVLGLGLGSGLGSLDSFWVSTVVADFLCLLRTAGWGADGSLREKQASMWERGTVRPSIGESCGGGESESAYAHAQIGGDLEEILGVLGISERINFEPRRSALSS